MDTAGKRHILGVSVALSEQGPHWRQFLAGLVKRGLSGVNTDVKMHKSPVEFCSKGQPKMLIMRSFTALAPSFRAPAQLPLQFLPRLRRSKRPAEQTRPLALFEPVTLAPDVNGRGVALQPVENSGCYRRFAKHLPPIRITLVGGQQNAAPLITRRHQLEEDRRSQRIQRKIPHLIHNQDFGLEVVAQARLQLPFPRRFA